MLTIKETGAEDVKNIQRLWADGDVMRFVGFPDGLRQSDREMKQWYDYIASKRPDTNHYSIYDDGVFCGEAFYRIDRSHEKGAELDIKLFRYARGKGIAGKALSHAITEAFANGAEKVWVDPDRRNAKAIALYKRLGFSERPFPEYLLSSSMTGYVYMELNATPVKHFKSIEGNGLVHDCKGKLLIFLLCPEEHFPASGFTHIADLRRRILMQPVILHSVIENGAELIVQRFQIDRRIRAPVLLLAVQHLVLPGNDVFCL